MFNKTVLVVERDPSEAEKILAFFREYKFRNRIEVVHSKAEALDYIFETGKYKELENHELPGLILLDLLTERTPEVKVLNPLQAYLRTQKIPLIILTSSAEQEEQILSNMEGAIGFIRKPLDFTRFVEMIQFFGSKQGENEGASGSNE